MLSARQTAYGVSGFPTSSSGFLESRANLDAAGSIPPIQGVPGRPPAFKGVGSFGSNPGITPRDASGAVPRAPTWDMSRRSPSGLSDPLQKPNASQTSLGSLSAGRLQPFSLSFSSDKNVVAVASILEERPSDDNATSSEMKVTDLEEEDHENDGRQIMVAHASSGAHGDEKLHEVFLAMSTDGVILFKDLPELLDAADVPGTTEEKHGAILKFFANLEDSFKIEYDLVLNLFKYLVAQEDENTGDQVGVQHRGWFARRAARLSDAKATYLLLSIVVIVSFFSAFLVAGVAILLMFTNTSDALNEHLMRENGIFKDIVHTFATDIFFAEITNRVWDATNMISTIAKYVTSNSVLGSDIANLQYMSAFVAKGVDAWWSFESRDTFISLAKVMAVLAEGTTKEMSQVRAIATMDGMNRRLPDGYEVMLGDWEDATQSSVRMLTQFRYQDQCANGTCGATSRALGDTMRAALTEPAGALRTTDYRLAEVLVGYARSTRGIGTEVKLDAAVTAARKSAEIEAFFRATNEAATNGRQFLLGQNTEDGGISLLTQVKDCDETCKEFLTRSDGPLGKALAGETGMMEMPRYDGKAMIAAYTPIPSAKMGLVVEYIKADRLYNLIQDLAMVLDGINAASGTSSQEAELLAMVTEDGVKILRRLTKYRFAADCPSTGCVEPEYFRVAMRNCSAIAQTLRAKDYRGAEVAVGVACLEQLQTIIAVKLDVKAVDEEVVGIVVNEYNERNKMETESSHEFMLARLNPGVDPSKDIGYDDFSVLSDVKFPDRCLKPNCAWPRTEAREAVMNRPGRVPGTMTALNYAGVPVRAALAYDDVIGGGVGLVMERAEEEYLMAILQTTWIVLVYTFAVVLACTVLLVAFTRRMMRDMIRASDDAKLVIEREKQQFSALVTSMYPNYVVPRLLAGERHIVSEVPTAAVFFSDIYEFTSASNTLGSADLLQFMCYTYGLMDDIAVRHGVYKVKTIGDAYLAVTGLPGTPTTTACLDLLRFASCVAQIFSCRFGHPDKGQILATVYKTMSWNRGRAKGRTVGGPTEASTTKASEQHSQASYPFAASRGGGGSVSPSENSQTTLTRAVRSKEEQVSCLMSYGLATGPLIAGVLQGKSPMFDVWGKTVNLASRMESTGQPGRIHVAERVYKKVIGISGQPFSFETAHSSFCKGFGTVTSYFLRSTAEPPAKDLLQDLGLEPRFGLYYFENSLTKAQQSDEHVEGKAQVL